MFRLTKPRARTELEDRARSASNDRSVVPPIQRRSSKPSSKSYASSNRKVTMPKARIVDSNASLPLQVLGELSNEVWASLEPGLSDSPEEIETAQIRLATIILDLAEDGHLAPLEIAHTASRLMRRQMSTRKERHRA